MTVNVLMAGCFFGAGAYYGAGDWARTVVMLVCAVLIWALRDELRSRV